MWIVQSRTKQGGTQYKVVGTCSMQTYNDESLAAGGDVMNYFIGSK